MMSNIRTLIRIIIKERNFLMIFLSILITSMTLVILNWDAQGDIAIIIMKSFLLGLIVFKSTYIIGTIEEYKDWSDIRVKELEKKNEYLKYLLTKKEEKGGK